MLFTFWQIVFFTFWQMMAVNMLNQACVFTSNDRSHDVECIFSLPVQSFSAGVQAALICESCNSTLGHQCTGCAQGH